jgi:hypothetical protein
LPLPPVGLPAGIILLLSFIPQLKAPDKKQIDLALAFAIFLVSGVASANFSPLFDYSWLGLYFWYIAFLMLGYGLPSAISSEEHLTNSAILISSFSCSVATILILRHGWLNLSQIYNYLRTATGLFYTSLLGLVLARNRITQMSLYIVTLIALFYINARASFYLWLMLPLIAIIVKRGVTARNLLFSFVFIAVALAITPIILERIEHFLPENRVFLLLLDPQHDNSFMERSMLLQWGWNQIKEHPIVGYYNGFMLYRGQADYIHNILSYWHQFGLVSFSLLLTMLAVAARNVFAIGRGPIKLYAQLALVTILLELVFAKSYAYPDVFFVIGFSLGARYITGPKEAISVNEASRANMAPFI